MTEPQSKKYNQIFDGLKERLQVGAGGGDQAGAEGSNHDLYNTLRKDMDNMVAGWSLSGSVDSRRDPSIRDAPYRDEIRVEELWTSPVGSRSQHLYF